MNYESFSLLPIGRRAGVEGLREQVKLFSFLLREPRVEFKDKTINRGRRPVSPHPNPLPMGEGDKNFPARLVLHAFSAMILIGRQASS